ncbi:MAG: trimethylamine methyltransferase family protein [Candidatus Hodarchaeales archaeon]|jgi:trimethylamine--corrinoid protein Co-methyltransferase
MMQLSILSGQQQDLIHSAALDVLRTVGCEIQDKRWLDELANGGVKVDLKTSRVFVTVEDLVNSALKSCGRKIKMMAREPKKEWILGQEFAKTHTPEGTTHVIDLKTRAYREARLSDLADITKICDFLPNVDAVVAPVIPYDVPPALLGVISTKTLMENSTKPISPAGMALAKAFPYVIEMILALAGDRDVTKYNLGVGVIATTPLQFPPDQLDIFWQGTELGTPCSVCSMPQAATTSPASLAGTLTLFTAEILMGLIMGQIKKPGIAQFVFVRPCISNPRYGTFNSGPPESGLLQAASTQLCREKYQLPVNAGWAVSDSHCIDPQTSYDKCYIWLMTMMAGANMLSGVGGLGSGFIASVAQTIIDNEIIGHIRRGYRGLKVDDFHLGVEMIKNIGIGGTFLSHPKTGNIIRDEWWLSKLPNRYSYRTWEAAGKPDFIEKAEEEAREILQTHTVEPLDPDLEEKLDNILHKAKNELM